MIGHVHITRTLVAVCGFTLVTSLSAADDPPLPRPSGNTIDAVNAYRESRGIPPAELKGAKAAFASFAKYYGDVVVHPLVYKAPQEGKVGTGGPRIPTIDWDLNTGVLRDLDRFLLVPTPDSKVTTDQADYIREMGAALDAALRPVIETHQERIVRVNATRMLASACKSGATAHWPTVTALLTDTFYEVKDKAGKVAKVATPSEIKFYALQAAANLLAAYDVAEYKIRKHANNPKEVADLIAAVQQCVENPNALVPGIPDGKIESATPDQLAVISYLRRQAIRTLAEVRSVSFPGPDGKMLYPAFTLARVCASDPAIIPAPTPAECAEAIIGLCNMAPVYMGNQVKNYNSELAVEAITAGLITFAKPRTNPTDRSLPWRGYAARLTEALRNWGPLFDPGFDPANPGGFNRKDVPARVTELLERAQSAVLVPMDKVGPDGKPDPTAPVSVEDLTKFLSQLRANPKRDPQLFRGIPATTLVFPENQ